MNVLVAHEAADSAGGVEAYLGALIPELRRRGHRVAALHHRDSGGRASRAWVDAAEWSVGVERDGMDGSMERVARWRPQIVFSHNMGPLAVESALLGRWPVVKMMHGYFGTCVSGLKTRRFPSARACDRTSGPACLALYAACGCGRLSARDMLRGYRWAAGQRALFPRYAAVGVPSDHLRAEYERHGVPADRLTVLPLFATNGAHQSLGDSAKRPAGVVFVGRMTSLKGGDLLVRAMARVARTCGAVPLVMAGEGPQRDEWRRLAARLGVDAEFTGWLQPSQRNELLSRARLLVLPSIWPEPFGLVGLEAAALGVPSVAFDVGGVGEWLLPGSTGVLVDAKQGADGLAAGIERLLTDEPLRQRLADGARARARQMTVALHADRLERLLIRASSSPVG